jgi:hypothetical protein
LIGLYDFICFTKRAGMVGFRRLKLKAPTMGWFRCNGGKGAWLALFALACQLAFTFGHVHVGSVSALRGLAISADEANGPVGTPSSPTQKTPTGLVQDFCAVCSNISLANTLVLPASPAVLRPISFIRDLQWPLVAFELASHRHFHFNARGPPPHA